MTDREKLIEILRKTIFPHELVDPTEAVADYLLDNGVTFATDTNVGSKWIPVTERLPEKNGEYLCRYVFGDYDDMPFYQALYYYAAEERPHFQHELEGGSPKMKVTHWMPMPEPPKENDYER